jgi:decaprenyl-phosphate phosphoribosyltransferase
MIGIGQFLSLYRPKQWVKNGFILAPLFFSLRFNEPTAVLAALMAVASFVLAAGAVYIFNDLRDIEEDRKHPVKRYRAVPAGKVSVRGAVITAVLSLSGAVYLSTLLPAECLIVLSTYLVVNFLYSMALKQVAILDVNIVAMGFVLRVLMGSYAIRVDFSPWIILTTFLLALFLGFGKRLHELSTSGKKVRHALAGYNRALLDKLINVTCATALLSYAIYAVETAARQQKIEFVYTVFFVVLGLFRYLQFLYFDEEGGAPESIIYRDKFFTANILLWLITCIWILSA